MGIFVVVWMLEMLRIVCSFSFFFFFFVHPHKKKKQSSVPLKNTFFVVVLSIIKTFLKLPILKIYLNITIFYKNLNLNQQNKRMWCLFMVIDSLSKKNKRQLKVRIKTKKYIYFVGKSSWYLLKFVHFVLSIWKKTRKIFKHSSFWTIQTS